MRILYVITKGNWGGAQRYVFDLAVAAKAQGHDVSVAFGEPGLLEKKLVAEGIKVHLISSFQRDVAVGKDTGSFFEVYRLFKRERPDVVHLNSSKAGGVGALAARLTGVSKIIFTAHGWAFNEKRNLLVRIILWLLSYTTAMLATDVICVSDYELNSARQMPFVAKKAVRIYNGIDLNMHFDNADVVRHSFPAGVKITGTVGELTKNKNQIALIEQAKKNPSMYVAIVGEGELRPMLEAKIKEYGLDKRVILFGFMLAQQVMKGFDVFAFPSIKEGLGYVVLEARAAGLPIVANRVGGVGEAMDLPLSEFSKEKMIEQTFALYR